MKINKLITVRFKHLLQSVEHWMHCVYLGTVATFAQGPYAYAAGGLLIVLVVALMTGAEEGV